MRRSLRSSEGSRRPAATLPTPKRKKAVVVKFPCGCPPADPLALFFSLTPGTPVSKPNVPYRTCLTDVPL